MKPDPSSPTPREAVDPGSGKPRAKPRANNKTKWNSRKQAH
ncbi:hypothetical protein H477_5195 [[Clostridium] sordellii ATCC 9714]|nr:hypothetical protein H477_5195 [[Clostridium] sordellii ATCC 9714] [Paeniclostridium sordellii ATCC 9714]